MKHTLKILFVLTPRFHPNNGGVQMTTYKLARWFASSGHDVSIFSFRQNGHIHQEFAKLFTPDEVDGATEAGALASLHNALESIRPDVVINQMPYDHAIGEVLASRKSYLLLGCLRNSLFSVKNNIDSYLTNVLPKAVAPLFKNKLGHFVLWRRHKRRHSADLRQILATYDRFVMFGPPNLEELSEFVPDYDNKKVALIPNSVPSVLEDVPVKEKRILWLGRLEYQQKRADLILPLWEIVALALPGWHLDVVGDGPALDEVRRKCEERAIERVTFHGRQKPDAYFERAAIFLMTSAYEGFPNVLVEAQSYGCVPVIFDSYPIASWVVNDGQDGFLEKPFDIKAMSERIIDLVRSADQHTLTERSLENAGRFRIDNVGSEWESLFESSLTDFRQGSD